MNDQIKLIGSTPFKFEKRRQNIPADLRSIWRISALCLILEHCRGKKASVQKLQILNWAIRNKDSQESMIRFLKGESSSDDVIIRYDPAFPMALNALVGDSLCNLLTGDKIALSEKGKDFAKEVEGLEDCMLQEKSFLKEAKPFFTEGRIQQLISESK